MPNPYAAPETKVVPDAEPEVHPTANPPAAPPSIARGDRYVTVYSTSDLVLAEMLDAMLNGEGIPTPGFSKVTGAQMGAGWMAGSHAIRVPSEREPEAHALIESFLAVSPAEEHDEEEADLPVQTRGSRRKTVYWRLLRGGVALYFVLWLVTLSPRGPQ
jgi:hypothetical protein